MILFHFIPRHSIIHICGEIMSELFHIKDLIKHGKKTTDEYKNTIMKYINDICKFVFISII